MKDYDYEAHLTTLRNISHLGISKNTGLEIFHHILNTRDQRGKDINKDVQKILQTTPDEKEALEKILKL